MAKVELPTREDYPNNSDRERDRRENDRQQRKTDIQPVAKATKRQKSFGKKFAEAFIGEETDQTSVKDYIIFDVAVPALKGLITDAITGGLEMILYGERRGQRTSRDRGRSYVNYSSYSSSSRDRDRDDRGRNRRRSAREKIWNDDIVLSSRAEAEQVIDRLLDIIEEYGSASVADLYSLTGIDSDFTDNRYGWTDLYQANVTRVRDGYLLNLPRAHALD